MRWWMIAILGLGLGLVAALGEAAAGVVKPTLASQALTIATHLGTTYAAAAVAAGWLLAKHRLMLLAGPVVLFGAVVGYIGYVRFFVDHDRLTVSTLSGVVGIYLLAALTVGPFLSMVGEMARSKGVIGTVSRVSVPAALVAEVALRYPLHRDLYQIDPTRAWTLTAIIGIGVLGFFAGTLGHRADHRH